MSKIPHLQIEVQETLRRIVVTMPRTTYNATFGLISRGLCLLSGFGPDDRKSFNRLARICGHGRNGGHGEGASIGLAYRRGKTRK
jgi:hypothetical protein